MNKKIFTVLVLMMVAAVSCFAQQRGLFLDFDNKSITVMEIESPEEVQNGVFFYETTEGVFRIRQGKVENFHKPSLRDAVTSCLTPNPNRMTAEKMRKNAERLAKTATPEEKEKLADLIAQAEENDRRLEELYEPHRIMLTQLDNALNELYGVEEEEWR